MAHFPGTRRVPPCELIPSITLTFLLCSRSDNSALRQHELYAHNLRYPATETSSANSTLRQQRRCSNSQASLVHHQHNSLLRGLPSGGLRCSAMSVRDPRVSQISVEVFVGRATASRLCCAQSNSLLIANTKRQRLPRVRRPCGRCPFPTPSKNGPLQWYYSSASSILLPGAGVADLAALVPRSSPLFIAKE